MSSAVRDRIASYEANSKHSDRTSQPSAQTNEDPLARKEQNQEVTHEGSEGSMASKRGGSGGEDHPSKESPSTAVAAHSRVSRMRQEQMARDGKTHQAQLMEKRKLMKGRRIFQQKRAPAAAPNSAPDHSQDEIDSPALGRTHADLTRRTQYSPTSFASVESESQTKALIGHDQPEKGRDSKPIATSSSSVNKAIPQQSSIKSFQRRQRQSSLKRRALRGSNSGKGIRVEASPSLSPTSKEQRLGHLTTNSPVSDADRFSDSNYHFGFTDNSVEPTTDDEATLTSVRRIMTGENALESPNEVSHRYHNLKSRSHENDGTISSVKRGGSVLEDSHERGARYSSMQTALGMKNSREGRNRWPDEEKSEKASIAGMFRTASSSDYDTDGEISKMSRQSNNIDGPSQSQATDVNEFFTQSQYAQGNRRADDDDRTFDYGDRDDASNDGSTSFATRRQRETEKREGKLARTKTSGLQTGPSSLINKEDVEHYTKALGSPTMKLGAGVLGAVTIGSVILGPAGLLAGAAAVGLGVGYMQIPEDERSKIQAKMQKTVGEVHDKAVDATESFSNSCVATYEESGMAEHLGPCLSIPVNESGGNKEQESPSSNKIPGGGGANDIVAGPSANQKVQNAPSSVQEAVSIRVEPARNPERPRNKKVACLRNVRILAASQIHGLDPTVQPKAWLDVVASAKTSEDEKNEALEEILILAKDKRRARIFLEEGILDSLIWTVDRYIEKVNARDKSWANTSVSLQERKAVQLAATCCVTLGKAHCAAIHTEGDLQLMSLYERGTVPEERQVAQMLHEIPHHVRITKTSDPTIIEPSKEVFALRQLNIHQAEEFAQTIKEVAEGKL